MIATVRTIRSDEPEEKRVGGFLIEKGVPLVPQGRKAAKMLTVILSLEPGESFVHTKRVKPGNFKGYIPADRHYAVRAVQGGFRCWRLK